MVSYTPVFTTQSASLTQLVECHLAKVVVEGSSPLARSIVVEAVNGSIAQLVEQVTLNHWVVGSNPSAPTSHNRSWLGSSVGRATD